MLCGRQHCGADGINDRWVKIEYKKDKYGWGVVGGIFCSFLPTYKERTDGGTDPESSSG